jgi:hypothetical protein
MTLAEKLIVTAARNYFAQECKCKPDYHWFNLEIENTDEALLEHIEAEAHASGNILCEDSIEEIQVVRLERVLAVMIHG